jgi:NADH-quinone oxidoreductase subunit J
MIRLKKRPGMFFPAGQLLPAIFISVGFLLVNTVLVGRDTSGWAPLSAAQASPMTFGVFLFQAHWLAVEIASMLLLVALVGAYVLGIRVRPPSADRQKEAP